MIIWINGCLGVGKTETVNDMHHNFDGHIIIPMTLVNIDYYNEIIGKLQNENIEIHFVLT